MSKDSYKNRWHILDDLGEGGQGKVYSALDNNKINLNSLNPTLANQIRQANTFPEKAADFGDAIRKTILKILEAENYTNHGALKVLHETESARDEDQERAEKRIRDEIKVMTDVSHPNLLKILDSNPNEKWFVSEFHPFGTLDGHLNKFKGDIVASLAALRPVVEGVALLHNKGIVHRDIKPHNIFVGENHNLILGDFGLVFLTENDKSRVSPTFDNVGSRDWMPGWAQGIRIEDVNPSFDAFSLGKVLWSMISGIPKLQLWYFKRAGNDLESLFPEDHNMRLVNSLLETCVVEDQENCLHDASELLEEIDKILKVLRVDADIISVDVQRPCKVCGLGRYNMVVNQDPVILRRMGFPLEGGHNYKFFACENCGHVQLFYIRDDILPPAWQ